MTRRTRLTIIYILTCIVVVLLGLDALLYHLDPLGTRIMFYNWIALQSVAQPHPTGYQYQQGVYDLGFYSVTIIEDGKRLVPDSGSGECVIAFVGDSMTFGQGVSDAETFINRIAQHFPNIMIWNTGRTFYSVENVAVQVEHYHANGYIWFVFQNDAQPFVQQHPRFNPIPATGMYLGNIVGERMAQNEIRTWGAYGTQAQALVERPDLLAFGFLDDPLAVEGAVWGVRLIPNPHDTVSVADKHPSAQGHAQITESLLPFAESFISRMCHD